MIQFCFLKFSAGLLRQTTGLEGQVVKHKSTELPLTSLKHQSNRVLLN